MFFFMVSNFLSLSDKMIHLQCYIYLICIRFYKLNTYLNQKFFIYRQMDKTADKVAVTTLFNFPSTSLKNGLHVLFPQVWFPDTEFSAKS